jgi:hypothetical protein
LVDLTDVGAFGVKGRIGFWCQPVTKAMVTTHPSAAV